MNIHELLGREIEARHQLLQEYAKLLDLVARLKAGTADIANVEVDTIGQTWRATYPAPSAE